MNINKFIVFSCIKVDEAHSEYAVVLTSIADPSMNLLFPIKKEDAKIINSILEDKINYDIDDNVVGVYKTMIDSWEANDHHLAGIIIDPGYDKKSKEDIVNIRLMLINDEGELDGLVPVSFIHAVYLSSMEKIFIIINDALLEDVRGGNSEESDDKIQQQIDKVMHKRTQGFPEDKEIMNIAKKIMSGKIKK
jgi:hypothetical protein